MVSKYRFIENELSKLQTSNLYRTLNVISTDRSFAKVNGRRVIDLSSNDYLGLSSNTYVIDTALRSFTQVSQCSSRLVAGNHPNFLNLENLLAKHRLAESALIYPTGYMANLGIISTIADKHSTIFSDEFNHASIIDGCKLSGATVKIFRHNDISHLGQLMKMSKTRKIVVTEGLFSVDGDISNLRSICRIAQEQNAIIIVDDAHGDFIFGRANSFSGIPSHLRVGREIDIHVSSMSKALGCFGGYVACSSSVMKFLVNRSRPFIYTSALPEHLCAAAASALQIAKKGKLQRRLFSNIGIFSKHLRKLGFRLRRNNSQIIPITIGPEKLSIHFSSDLLKMGIFAPPMRYPTVKKGFAGIRFCITSLHTKEQLLRAIDSIEEIARTYKII
ncbi:MAG TPA: aminotransferase class I/II-fold pyridoxal phosphate-dependent enzyme [Nitrososphaeraceae archaeon]|nr:aminotransferase class I/II-fold pyridoxal phosphate-dependent enzyme [Nitrososphaeraceae archaeon]